MDNKKSKIFSTKLEQAKLTPLEKMSLDQKTNSSTPENKSIKKTYNKSTSNQNAMFSKPVTSLTKNNEVNKDVKSSSTNLKSKNADTSKKNNLKRENNKTKKKADSKNKDLDNKKTFSFFPSIKLKTKKTEPQITTRVKRVKTDYKIGLTTEQVQERIEKGQTNAIENTNVKTYRSIFFENIVTFFNILCFAIALSLAIVGSYKDLLFMLIIIANTAIGIFTTQQPVEFLFAQLLLTELSEFQI